MRLAHCGPPLLFRADPDDADGALDAGIMYSAKPVTIEIVASGAGPAEISLLTAGVTEAEYVGDAGAFAFQVRHDGEGQDNADAPPAIVTVNNNLNKTSNLRAEHKVYSRSNGHLDMSPSSTGPGGPGAIKTMFSASNGHLPNNQVPPSKNNNNKNFFLSRKNNNDTNVSMTFLQSLDAKLQRLHDYTTRGRRNRRAVNANEESNNNNNNKDAHKVQHPRPFMTVVRQGTFLKPPPELAALLGLSPGTLSYASSAESSLSTSHHHPSSSLNSSMLYSFASRPRVLMQAHRHHCDAAPGRSKRSVPGNAPPPPQQADDT